MLAFLDPADIRVGAVDDLRLLAFVFHMLPRARGAGDDGSVDDSAACALHFQATLFQLAIDQRQQLLIQLSPTQAIAEAADHEV